MPKLTKQFIENEIQSPTIAQAIYRDDELRGFAIRVTPQSKSFIVERRINKINKRITIGKYPDLSVEAARKLARVMIGEMASGNDPRSGKPVGSSSGVTLREVLEKYLAVKRLRPQTQRAYRQLVGKNLCDWLDVPLTAITKDMVEVRHQELSLTPTRRGTSGHGRANNTLKALSALISFASDRYGTEGDPLIKVNPVSRLTRTNAWHTIRPRQGIIQDHKLADWYRAVATLKNDVARDFLIFLLLTGMRRGETQRLQWSHVDLEQELLTVPREITKTDREHCLPLSKFLVALLKQRYPNRVHSDWVFQSSKDRSKHISEQIYFVKEVRDKSGIYFQLHDLRRTFLTMAEKLDVPHYALKKLVNHHIGSEITGRYIILDVERLRPHMKAITESFLELLGANVHELSQWKRIEAANLVSGRQLHLSLKDPHSDEPDSRAPTKNLHMRIV